ncbi:sodium-coupled monocarboxylate transporter 2-like [Palaemon carinicauda]|uniref:sodium-coupled monocarboxylate transporter 2-like n=1 Tax=Palaemon carinicauda TaxID=392227 RepID=UPI0035B5BB25
MDDFESKKLGVVDWVLFSSLLVVSLGIGIYSALRGRGNSSTQEYLLGGRQMSPIPVAVSLLGGVISAISILGLATEMYFYGTQLILSLLGCVYGTFTVQLLILPILYPLKIVSANEYINLRFGSERLRKFATLCSVFMNFTHMGLYLYAPSLTLSTVTNLSTYSSICIMGIICTFYITVGGVKAVVYTDVIQTIMMFLGVLVAVVVCIVDLGGVANVYQINKEGGRLEFFNMSTDPLVRHTFWSVQVQGFYNMVAWIGLNQTTYQRFASVSTLTLSKRLCTFFLVGLHALWLTFFFSGVVAYATYSDCDPWTSGRIEKPDQILPYLVLDKLSHLTGMAGLFVAAVYGGVLSSLSSSGNSVACLLWEDILKDLKIFKDITDVNATRVIKMVSAAAGLIGIGVGLLAGYLGNIMQVSSSVGNAFTGSVTGIFISGMCAPWVNLKGAYAGYITALLFNLWLVIGQFVIGQGDPEKLPLSTENCPDQNLHLLLNSTLDSLTNTTEPSLPSVLLGPTVFVDDISRNPDLETDLRSDGRNIYHLSYCYTGILGIIINFVVSSIVSLITDKVDARLISPRCLRFYKRIWKAFDIAGTQRGTKMDLQEKVDIPMIDKRGNDCMGNIE